MDDYKKGLVHRRSYDDPLFTYTKFVAGDCTDKETGLSGICTLLRNCDFANSHNYTVCGFESCNKFVCCPYRKHDAKSLQACEDYSESVFEFKRVSLLEPSVNQKISCSAISPSGGKFASPKQFPHI